MKCSRPPRPPPRKSKRRKKSTKDNKPNCNDHSTKITDFFVPRMAEREQDATLNIGELILEEILNKMEEQALQNQGSRMDPQRHPQIGTPASETPSHGTPRALTGNSDQLSRDQRITDQDTSSTPAQAQKDGQTEPPRTGEAKASSTPCDGTPHNQVLIPVRSMSHPSPIDPPPFKQ